MAQKCVHSSCGKTFSDANEDCVYHPGPPIFHEGQKGWKCCKPRVLTFDEFLSIPPCTTGKHSTTDFPPQLEKKQPDGTEPALNSSPEPGRAPIASNASSMAISSQASTGIATSTPPPPPAQPESDTDDPSLPIPANKICRRKACGQSYEGGSRDGEKCVFHPGVPIFHEGSKGYTCCKRRVLEFDEFLRIEGCETKDGHLFVGSGGKRKGRGGKGEGGAEAEGEEVVGNVRHDFYQTPSSVIASFFLKKINKETAKTEFASNQLTLDLRTTDAPPKRYKAVIPLFGQVDPEKSSAKILGTKLEVTFVKADGAAWPVLRGDEPVSGEILQVGRAGRAV